MQLIFTHENRLFVANAKNILESQGFEIQLKNEFVSSAIGEVSPFDCWLEIWLFNDADYEAAKAVIDQAFSNRGATPWRCGGCGEENDPSFDWCWQCGKEKPV